MSDDVTTIVIDAGSFFTKAGFAGDEIPRSVFPSVVGRPKYVKFITQLTKNPFIGNEAINKIGVLINNNPIKQKMIDSWDDYEKLIHFSIFNELRMDSSEHPLILTESPLNTKEAREKNALLMFETFCVPSLYIAYQSTLDMLSATQSTEGISLDVGENITCCVPYLSEGSISLGSISSTDVGGSDVTDYLKKALDEQDQKVNVTDSWQFFFKTKCDHCYVAEDYIKELEKKPSEIEKKIRFKEDDYSLGYERFKCAEVLFNPYLGGKTASEGISQIVLNSIMKCDPKHRPMLYQKIVLGGGTSLMNSFVERLEKEIKKSAPKDTKVRVIATYERKYQTWVGGSILSTLPTFPQMVVTRDEYNEVGPSIINNRKTF